MLYKIICTGALPGKNPPGALKIESTVLFSNKQAPVLINNTIASVCINNKNTLMLINNPKAPMLINNTKASVLRISLMHRRPIF
jgi:hypothetical protein